MCWSITLISRRQNRSSIGEEAACKSQLFWAKLQVRWGLTQECKKKACASNSPVTRVNQNSVIAVHLGSRSSKYWLQFVRKYALRSDEDWKNQYFPDNDKDKDTIVCFWVFWCGGFLLSGMCYQTKRRKQLISTLLGPHPAHLHAPTSTLVLFAPKASLLHDVTRNIVIVVSKCVTFAWRLI